MYSSSIMSKHAEESQPENSIDTNNETRDIKIKREVDITETLKSNNNDPIKISQVLKKKPIEKRRIPKSLRKDRQPRICGNGKPMPSLAQLKKLYEDSEDDDETETKTEVELSPNFIQNVASQLLDKLSNISGPEDLLELLPTPVVVEKKKTAKSVPHIVGCKDRKQVITKMKTNFCKGSPKYGVNLNPAAIIESFFTNFEDINLDTNIPSDGTSTDQHDTDQKQNSSENNKKRKHKKANTENECSKSIFNAMSDQIALKLREDKDDGSSDSDQTIDYDYDCSSDSSSDSRNNFDNWLDSYREKATRDMIDIDERSVGSCDSASTVEYNYSLESMDLPLERSQTLPSVMSDVQMIDTVVIDDKP